MDNKPHIRFSGFINDWEHHKCGEVLIERNVQHPQNDEFPLVSFTVESGVTPKTERYEREQLVRGDKASKKYKETRLDDIVYNPANLKFGAISRNKFGNAVFSPIYVTYEVDKSLATASFVEKYVTRDSFIQNALHYQQGTVYERMSVNTDDFASLDIELPSKEEQRKIGVYFDNLDNLITLHQRKYNALIQYKEYLLLKLFPCKDSLIPEVRISGFTGKWEKYKLGDLYSERNERGNDFLQILSVSIHSGVSDGELDEESLGKIVRRSEDKSTYKHVYKGDLVFNMMRAWQGAIGVVKSEGMVSPAYISAVPNEKVYPLFMDYALRRSKTIAEINNLSYGIRDFRKRLYWNSFIHVNCMLPSIEEQKKIYEFLKSIDEYISVLQRKCNELKKLKKYLLQNMFCN